MDTKLSSLPQLQGFIKKDPESYRDDFEKQFENYKELKELFKRDPKKKMSDFYDIVMFIAHVSWLNLRLFVDILDLLMFI